MLLLLAIIVAPERGQAQTTFTVNSTNDTGAGTLRQAILDANANAGTDTIKFNISGTGPHAIQPLFALPTITDPLFIDGYSQPGASPNTNGLGVGSNAVLMIELDGINSGAGVTGLSVTAGSSTVRGLVINRFSLDGVHLSVSGNNVIEGNFIGTDVTGTTQASNAQRGILIEGVPDNRIGGTASGAGNVISGNNWVGIEILGGGAAGNLVQANFIGTDLNGAVAVGGNYQSGIRVNGARNNIIGGLTAETRNVISGNGSHGVLIVGFAPGNMVQGNYIGTDVTGTAAVGNSSNGVWSVGAGTIIGGTASGAGNIFAFNVRE